MDDPSNGEYSRAPEIQDLIQLCGALNDANAKYIIIGGFAVILHGSVRGTKDIDLLIETSERNVQTVKKAMSTLPDNAAALIDDSDVANYSVVRIADEFIVDLMAAACGITYNEAINDGIDHISIDGIDIPFASKPLLIRMKDTIRNSDRADIEFLKVRILAEHSKK